MTITTASLHPWIAIWAAHMVNGAVAGVALAVLAEISLRFAGRQSSSARFTAWFAVLLSIAILPFARSARATAGVTHVALPGMWATYAVLVWMVVAGVL